MTSDKERISVDAQSEYPNDILARRDFEAIKDSRRVADWRWFVNRHKKHPLAEMVRGWITEHISLKGRAKRLMSKITSVVGTLVSVATILGVWITWQQHRSTSPEDEQALDSPKNVQIAEGNIPAPINPPDAPISDRDYLVDWQDFFTAQGFRYFRAEEFLFLGAANYNPDHPCYGLNELPSRELWPNIVPTIRALEIVRAELGYPINLISVYRSPEYNTCLGSAGPSFHVQFMAADFVVVGSGTKPADWASLLRERRNDGNFKGGVGAYDTFVHLDTRGTNADWDG